MRGGWKADLQLPSQRVTIQAEVAAPLESTSEPPSTADSSVSGELASLPNLSKLLSIIGEDSDSRSSSNHGAAGRKDTSHPDKPL